MRKRLILAGIVFLIFCASALLNIHSKSVSEKDDSVADYDTVIISPEISCFDEVSHCYDIFFLREFEKYGCPGAAVAIVSDNGTKWLKGYGVKEAGSGDSVNVNTVFRLGSVSKGFAAVLTGILVQEGILSWDDKVVKYLPDFSLNDSVNTNNLTIRHILSHTTGLPKHTYTNLLDCNVPYRDIVDMLEEVPAISPPGEVYSYQNVVYSLIADILQNATGKCYNSLMVEKLFYPLEMNDASIDFYSLVKCSNSAKPHLRRNSTYRTGKICNKYYSTSPASGVNTSISDLSNYLMALLNKYPEVISEDILNEIYKPHIRTYIKRRYACNWKGLGDIYYGLGWRVFNFRGNEIIYHGGYVTGYRAEIAICPKEGIAIAVMMNSSSKLANICIPAFFDMYFSETMI